MAVGLRPLLADPESLVGLKLGCEGVQYLFSWPGVEISSLVEAVTCNYVLGLPYPFGSNKIYCVLTCKRIPIGARSVNKLPV
jgi:hypothetical protein